MRRLSLRRRAWLLGGVGVVALAGAAIAGAAVLTAGTPVRVPDNPLAANAACAPLVAQQTAAGSINYPDSEVEPYVAVGSDESAAPRRERPAGPLERRRIERSHQRRVDERRRDLAARREPAAVHEVRRCCARLAGRPQPGDRPVGELLVRRARSSTRSATPSTPTGRRSAARARSSSAARPTAATTWQTPVTARFDASIHRAERQGDGDRRSVRRR